MDSFDIIDHYISRLDFMLKDENQRKPDYNEFKVQFYKTCGNHDEGYSEGCLKDGLGIGCPSNNFKFINNMDIIGINTLKMT